MKTSEILKGMLFFAGIVILTAACNKKDDTPDLDFDITVPDGWAYFALNSDNIVYYASSPLEDQNDSIQEDVLVTKDAIGIAGLEQFAGSVITSLAEDTSFHALYYSQDTTINGAVCRKLIHLQTLLAIRTGTNDSVFLELKDTRYFFTKNSFGYVVSLNALAATYPTYRPIFETIISSFKFKN